MILAGTVSSKFAGALPGVWVSVSSRGLPCACTLIHPLMQKMAGEYGKITNYALENDGSIAITCS